MKPKKPRHRRGAGKEPESLGKRLGIVLWSALLGIATLLGYVVLIPRVTPVFSDPPDPDNPFSSSLTITNSSYYPLNSVSVRLLLGTICTDGVACPEKTAFPDLHRYEGAVGTSTSFQKPQWGKHDLPMDTGFTIAIDDIMTPAPGTKIEYADFEIIISYEIPIVHWRREKAFPCHTRQQSNGKLYWYWG
jgi:hypothetical protein